MIAVDFVFQPQKIFNITITVKFIDVKWNIFNGR